MMLFNKINLFAPSNFLSHSEEISFQIYNSKQNNSHTESLTAFYVLSYYYLINPLLDKNYIYKYTTTVIFGDEQMKFSPIYIEEQQRTYSKPFHFGLCLFHHLIRRFSFVRDHLHGGLLLWSVSRSVYDCAFLI